MTGDEIYDLFEQGGGGGDGLGGGGGEGGEYGSSSTGDPQEVLLKSVGLESSSVDTAASSDVSSVSGVPSAAMLADLSFRLDSARVGARPILGPRSGNGSARRIELLEEIWRIEGHDEPLPAALPDQRFSAIWGRAASELSDDLLPVRARASAHDAIFAAESELPNALHTKLATEFDWLQVE